MRRETRCSLCSAGLVETVVEVDEQGQCSALTVLLAGEVICEAGPYADPQRLDAVVGLVHQLADAVRRLDATARAPQ